MKQILILIIVFLIFCVSPDLFAARGDTVTVKLTSTVSEAPLKITLSWESVTGDGTYNIYRRDYGSTSWGSPIASALPDTTTSYEDTSVSEGVLYEYRVLRGSTSDYADRGFVTTGIKVPAVEERGKVLFIVDETNLADIESALHTHIMDMVGDGWQVIRHDVPRVDWEDAGYSAGVQAVKTWIVDQYNADPSGVKTVYLFGHVATPYAGSYARDGHSGHVGAWPSDTYYGDIDGTWTDSTVDMVGGSSDPDRLGNVPGDGKFDQNVVPSDLELAVGRVDLADLSDWTGTNEKNMRIRYINKVHNFRHRVWTVQRQGGIEEVFDATYGATGWRNFSAMFGHENIYNKPWYWWKDPSDADPDDPASYPHRMLYRLSGEIECLWTYINGPGWWAGILPPTGYTGKDWCVWDDTSVDPKTVFTMQFGSWWADWDVNLAYLRFPLATRTYSLTCSWSGWGEDWQYHHMAMGENIGECVRRTVNDLGDVIYCLMGDPTLIQYPVIPVSGFTASANGPDAELSWTASTDTVLGYHVYRSASETGPYTRLTTSEITGTTYTDTDPGSGTWWYMVRALKLETGSGTYYNLSQGIFDSVGIISGPQPEINVKGGGQNISDGDSSPGSGDGTDFGSVDVDGGTAVNTFTIENTGSADLTVSSVTVSGTYSGDFTVTATPAGTVSASGTTTFEITFDPSGSGTRTAVIHVNNSDSDEADYDFAVTGDGAVYAPEITVSGNSQEITDGDSTPSLSDYTDFGSTDTGSGTIVRTFTIENNGNADLTVGTVSISGTHAGDFTVTASPSTPVSASGSTTFQITFDPSAAGLRTAEVSVVNNDSDENPYTFSIAGTGVADSDNDGMDDQWEIDNGVDDPDGDPDGDDLTNLEEFNNNTDPNDDDSDNDNLPDGWEVDNGFDPNTGGDDTNNSDSDSLTNLEEYQHGTDPNNSDTDNDTYDDDWELDNGYDPLDWTSNPDAGTGGGGEEVSSGCSYSGTDSPVSSIFVLLFLGLSVIALKRQIRLEDRI